MTHQEKFRASIKYKLLRLLWIHPKHLSVWAGNQIVQGSVLADKKDNP
jgi:hypothetical protein